MTEFLDALNKMKDMQIVRFFSQFFTQEKLAPILGQYKDQMAGGGGGLAKELVIWAIILAVGVFIIDQVFYWTSPGQLEQARGTWNSFTGGVANLGASARVLIDRAKGIGKARQGASHGRR
jgi:hypothetical protein